MKKAENHVAKGVEFWEAGLREEALRCFSDAIELDEECLAAFHNRALINAELGHDYEALADLAALQRAGSESAELVAALFTTYAHATVSMGFAQAVDGHPEGALELFERALVYEPKHPFAWNNLGVIHQSLGNDAIAAECFDKARNCGWLGPHVLTDNAGDGADS